MGFILGGILPERKHYLDILATIEGRDFPLEVKIDKKAFEIKGKYVLPVGLILLDPLGFR